MLTFLRYDEISSKSIEEFLILSQVNEPSNPLIICLSLATAPLLCTLLVAREVAQGLGELGEASEEVFRGDRLPTLNFPKSGATD